MTPNGHDLFMFRNAKFIRLQLANEQVSRRFTDGFWVGVKSGQWRRVARPVEVNQSDICRHPQFEPFDPSGHGLSGK